MRLTMHRPSPRRRRAVVVALVACGLAGWSSAAPAAAAATYSCDGPRSTPVENTYVDLWACQHTAYDDFHNDVQALMQFEGFMDPNGWRSCEVRVGLDVRYPDGVWRRRATTYHSEQQGCMSQFRAMSVHPGMTTSWSGPRYVAQYGYCYRPVTRWLGSYSGEFWYGYYDSGAIAGPVKCGSRTTPGIPADGVVDLEGDTPGAGGLPYIV